MHWFYFYRMVVSLTKQPIKKSRRGKWNSNFSASGRKMWATTKSKYQCRNGSYNNGEHADICVLDFYRDRYFSFFFNFFCLLDNFVSHSFDHRIGFSNERKKKPSAHSIPFDFSLPTIVFSVSVLPKWSTGWIDSSYLFPSSNKIIITFWGLGELIHSSLLLFSFSKKEPNWHTPWNVEPNIRLTLRWSNKWIWI